MEASRPYHHKFTRAASRPASNDSQIYNHPYTLLPESILSCTAIECNTNLLVVNTFQKYSPSQFINMKITKH